MRRLSTATLGGLPDEVRRPNYDRVSVRKGVVHLGIGAFHRAHQAVVFDDALASGDPRWGVVGVSLRSPGVRDRLAPQDGLYSVVERDGGRDGVRVIGAVSEVLVAPEDRAAVRAAMASADVHLVTLTVTEKGYGTEPQGAAALIADALAERRAVGLQPFTAISCDNLSGNGVRLRAAVLEAADRSGGDLVRWVEHEVAFPSTMVDRIVPATTEADIAALGQRIGVEDRATVNTEPFSQWVIEDRFAGDRPDFAALGAQLTSAVAPWEEAKLRLLNAAHSAIAYLGGLAGFEFVHEVVALPEVRAYLQRLLREAEPTIVTPPGLDLQSYKSALLRRFANPALRHRTHQIAADGSQKLPQRLLSPMAWRRARGLPVDAQALLLAAWIRWQDGRDDAGRSFVVEDPVAGALARPLAGAATMHERVVAALTCLGFASLASDPVVLDAAAAWLGSIQQKGVRGTLMPLP